MLIAIATTLASSLLLGWGGELSPKTDALMAQGVPSTVSAQGVTVTGTVVGFGEADENEWLIQTNQGTVLADAGPRWFQVIDIPLGETITLTGRWDEGEFDVVSITRADGRQIFTGRPLSGPPPWAGGRRNRERHRGDRRNHAFQGDPRPRGQTLSGTIVGFGEADENEWLVQTSQGIIRVDGGSRDRQSIDLPLGERVTFTGEFDDGEFDAFSVTRANGTVISLPHDD